MSTNQVLPGLLCGAVGGGAILFYLLNNPDGISYRFKDAIFLGPAVAVGALIGTRRRGPVPALMTFAMTLGLVVVLGFCSNSNSTGLPPGPWPLVDPLAWCSGLAGAIGGAIFVLGRRGDRR